MKKLFVFLLPVLLCGCAKVEIMYVKPDGRNKDVNQYTYESDSLQIVYSFWDNGGSIHFSILNKLSVPVFIDWKRSAFIKNGEQVYYWTDQGETSSAKDASTVSIAPGAKIEKKANRIYYSPRFIVYPSEAKIGVKYTRESSPVSFRNYIAYSTSASLDGLQYVDNGFYISGIGLSSGKKFRYLYSPMAFYLTP